MWLDSGWFLAATNNNEKTKILLEAWRNEHFESMIAMNASACSEMDILLQVGCSFSTPFEMLPNDQYLE